MPVCAVMQQGCSGLSRTSPNSRSPPATMLMHQPDRVYAGQSVINCSSQPSQGQQQQPARRRAPSKQQQQLPPRMAYSVAPLRTGQPRPVPDPERDVPVQPVQRQQLDDPTLWPEPQLAPAPRPAAAQPTPSTISHRPGAHITNPLRLPAHRRLVGPSPPGTQPGKDPYIHGHAAQGSCERQPHRHPPVAPEDPAELLQVLQVMEPPRRRIVIFKGGGYIYAEMEAMIESAGLGHVLRLTNLIRKAHCIVAQEHRDNGKRVNLAEHIAAARNANIPFLLIERLDPAQLVALLRPVLLRKRIVVEHPQRERQVHAAAGGVDGPVVAGGKGVSSAAG